MITESLKRERDINAITQGTAISTTPSTATFIAITSNTPQAQHYNGPQSTAKLAH
jgi:hypothetical protein